MVPRMSVVRRPSQGSPVSFKRRPRKNAAPSSEPCRICSARKATRLLPTPTRHRASRQKPLINYPAPLLGSGSLPGSCDQGIGRLGVPCPIILDVYLLMAGLIHLELVCADLHAHEETRSIRSERFAAVGRQKNERHDPSDLMRYGLPSPNTGAGAPEQKGQYVLAGLCHVATIMPPRGASFHQAGTNAGTERCPLFLYPEW